MIANARNEKIIARFEQSNHQKMIKNMVSNNLFDGILYDGGILVVNGLNICHRILESTKINENIGIKWI